ncbi:MAG: cell division topological specificity factor MinE [Bacillota bacterium]|nr:cell division topological specificity factor MinE [Bacillota bacterium]
MFDFLSRYKYNEREGHSKDVAKERLQLVLIHDRTSVTPELLNVLREEIMAVIERYMEIDYQGLEIAVERSTGRRAALVANVPIRRVKTGQK